MILIFAKINHPKYFFKFKIAELDFDGQLCINFELFHFSIQLTIDFLKSVFKNAQLTIEGNGEGIVVVIIILKGD